MRTPNHRHRPHSATDCAGPAVTAHLDGASGKFTLRTWAVTGGLTSASKRHSVVLALEPSTMERYADLDEASRMRVHTMLRAAMRVMIEHLPDDGEACTLTVELTDEMLDAACSVQ